MIIIVHAIIVSISIDTSDYSSFWNILIFWLSVIFEIFFIRTQTFFRFVSLYINFIRFNFLFIYYFSYICLLLIDFCFISFQFFFFYFFVFHFRPILIHFLL